MVRFATTSALTLVLCLSGCGSGEAPPAAPEPEAVDEMPAEAVTEPVEEARPPEAPAAPDLSAHEVVIVVLHDDPLLRSEERLLDVIAERMQMRRIDAIRREATEEESRFGRALFRGEPPGGELPATLSEVSTVVFLRVPENRELGNGQLATRGFGGVIAFRRGEQVPYVELRIDDAAAWRGADEQLWPWLISLVRAEVAS